MKDRSVPQCVECSGLDCGYSFLSAECRERRAYVAVMSLELAVADDDDDDDW